MVEYNIRKNCHSCLYRHGGYPMKIKNKCNDFYKNGAHDYSEDCPSWKIGRCYSCIHHDDDINDHEDKIEAWYKRGCETWCMSGCRKYVDKNKKWWQIWK